MIKGLYVSASGMIPHVKKQELSANNISNASSPGFKRDAVFTKELTRAEKRHVPQMSDWQQPMIDEVYTDFAPGIFDRTGNPLDLAIDGDGFFTLLTPDGQTALTRSGSFGVDANGFLMFPEGNLVMGEGGPIEVGDGDLSVSASGEVSVNGISVGRIQAQTVLDLDQLHKVGGSLFVVPEGVELVPVEKAVIRQGFLETSNVDIVGEMIDMIVSFRSYEANAKAVQSQDQSLEHLFNRVGVKV